VGVAPTGIKAVGPFARYQNAEATTVVPAQADVTWSVTPLLEPRGLQLRLTEG
jgi:hypothetical protein